MSAVCTIRISPAVAGRDPELDAIIADQHRAYADLTGEPDPHGHLTYDEALAIGRAQTWRNSRHEETAQAFAAIATALPTRRGDLRLCR